MPDSGAPDRYAVVGNPVAHSLSPRIHAEFARQTGQSLSYEAIEIATDAFAAGVADLQRQGYRGLNVTVPFKREAWELCDNLSSRAEIAGAVNTLILGEDNSVQGDNTDGVGLVRDLVHNLQIDLARKHILLLGAGGAARGVLEPLLAESPASLTIANRTLDRAHALARDFKHIGEIQVVAYPELKPGRYQLIINATAAGLGNQLPPLPAEVLDPGAYCYDMMYNLEAATAFVAWTREQGVRRSYDGLGMLIEQAAEAFQLWRGVRPDTVGIASWLRGN
jgi:shikimate dehydrogenase